MQEELVIYISGPLTADTEAAMQKNVEAAIDAFHHLIKQGHTPICPHLSYYADKRAKIQGPMITYDEWLEYDLKLISRCDAMLFIGPSKGANIEHAWAINHNIPIYYTLDHIKAPYPGAINEKSFLRGKGLCQTAAAT